MDVNPNEVLAYHFYLSIVYLAISCLGLALACCVAFILFTKRLQDFTFIMMGMICILISFSSGIVVCESFDNLIKIQYAPSLFLQELGSQKDE